MAIIDSKDNTGSKMFVLKNGSRDTNHAVMGKSAIWRLALDTIYRRTKFGDSNFSHSVDMIAGIEIEKGVMW